MGAVSKVFSVAGFIAFPSAVMSVFRGCFSRGESFLPRQCFRDRLNINYALFLFIF